MCVWGWEGLEWLGPSHDIDEGLSLPYTCTCMDYYYEYHYYKGMRLSNFNQHNCIVIELLLWCAFR